MGPRIEGWLILVGCCRMMRCSVGQEVAMSLAQTGVGRGLGREPIEAAVGPRERENERERERRERRDSGI